MDYLYTRSGRLLQRSGNYLHSRSGRYLGQVHNGKVFDPDGRYCGTVVGDRVVYRTIDSAMPSAASAAGKRTPSVQANRSGCSLWGVEPPFLD
jgi:hypothetical protein